MQGEPVKRNEYMVFLIEKLLEVFEDSEGKATFMQWFDLLNQSSNKYIKQATKCVDFQNYFFPVLSKEKFDNLKSQFEKIKKEIRACKKVNYDGEIEVHWYEEDQPEGTEPWKNSFPSYLTIGEFRD